MSHYDILVGNPSCARQNQHDATTAGRDGGLGTGATADRQAYLCGVDVETIQQIIDANDVELVDAENSDCLIDRASLREFWEICTELPSYTN